MPSGIQVFNPEDGTIQFDSSSRLGRMIGSVQTGTNNGSISVPGLTQGTMWAVSLGGGGVLGAPMMSVSGTTLSWSFDTIPAEFRKNTTYIYGVY